MRRIIVIALALALLVGATPLPAMAWCNGPAKNGHTGDGYGSHDWILDHAITKAGSGGAWVQRSVALLASDDPDTQKWGARFDHYLENGSCRGAAQSVADLYHKAVVAYRAGDMKAASRYLGQLSHCYSDILEPFHTTKAASGLLALHRQYEFAVDDHQNTRTKVASWFVPRAGAPVADVRVATIEAAAFARSLFPSLLTSYKASRSVTKGTPLKVTKLVMSRAVNDLADIVAAIPSGSGEAAMPAEIDMRVTRTNPRPNEHIGAYLYCADADGNPIEGVGVTFVWHVASGKTTWSTYTEANGNADRYQDIGDADYGQVLSVDAHVTVNGQTVTRTCEFTATRH